MYPNRATGFITIETDAGEVNILDVLGRVVLSSEANERIHVSGLSAGVYVARVGALSTLYTVR
ncbi:MAG: T9SS type A sorting domain-containing protein [Bacteroidetes bacterium]|nr:T9SS type A sorting domain-containing protein [Bacteroidota bacterium]